MPATKIPMQVVIQDVDSSLKHEVGAARFDYQLREEVVSAVALLNGNYAIRTAVPKTQMPAAEVIRSYEALARVELAFRSLKTVDNSFIQAQLFAKKGLVLRS